MTSISLSELTNQIQSVIRQNFTMTLWVRAEIGELRENNGNCYMELIEKDTETDNLTAKTRATCWSNVYRMLKPYFENSTGETLRAGLNVLVAVTVEFSGTYGFSLNVRDIDPTFTIGELAARRMEIVHQLEADGIVNMNKEITFPLLPRRIAVISSATAAGYGDFCDQLKNNAFGYVFYPKLFPALMQGDQAAASIIAALDKIYAHIELFDVVVIIRGGGATTDLACFDNYNLAVHCAQFPLPIIAGIGHQRDVSILDMIAHTSVKTPTAVAELLIFSMEQAESHLNEVLNEMVEIVERKINENEQKLDLFKFRLKQASLNESVKEKHRLDHLKFRLLYDARNRLTQERNKLNLMEKTLQSHSPLFLLEQGYSITTFKGKRLTSIQEIQSGDVVKTFLKDGSFESEVS